MVLFAGVGCDLPNLPAQASEPVCGAAACGSGEVRFCGTRCVTPRTVNQSCDAVISCSATTIEVCAANLVCAPSGGGYTCQDLSSRHLTRCDRSTDPPCPSSTYCLSLRGFNPNLNTDVGLCAGRLAEGQRCTAINGGTATLECEPGFTCNNGFCRRPCASNSDCSCATSTSNAACDTGAGFCTRCWSATGRDRNDLPLRCGANSQCCGGLTCNPDGSGTCCAAVTTSCASGQPCCAGSQCVSGTCTACGGVNNACTNDADCCGGTVSGGLRCSGPMGTRVCCPPGWGRNASGVCQDFRRDVLNCGTLGNVCPTGANGNRTCFPSPTTGLGVCDFVCLPGYGNCNGTVTDGCETDLTTASNCGTCGNNCPTPSNGTAICGYSPTNPALRACDVTCTYPAFRCGRTTCTTGEMDNNNCGMCGRVCPSGSSCVMGVCNQSGAQTCSHEIAANSFSRACTNGECCWEILPSGARVRHNCVQDRAGNWYCGYLNPGSR